ncbi:MAG TPA: dynamin [Anaerolineaceae bacterium]|jgi:small GTP-binding protein|nr:dynamin [Anaerolineaceae bacterium]
MKILTEQQEDLLRSERTFLNDLRVKLNEFNGSKSDLDNLGKAISQLDDLFLLVIVGEFNAGKTAVINALLGDKFLKEGITPTTSQINILRYGKDEDHRLVSENQELILLPIDLLSEVSIVDTPGTNAILREHEELTKQFIPQADIVLFITSVDRPFTESERQFMQQIKDWGKKVVILLNKTDILQNEEELGQVNAFVEENARALLGTVPEIFAVSARLALRAKNGEPDLWESSGFGALENFIKNTLDQKSQMRLKFLNPLGVSAHIIDKITVAAQAQREVLEKDTGLLQNVSHQLEIYRTDKGKEFSLRMAEVEHIFYEMEQRGDMFFEDRFRLVRLLDLIKKERLHDDFKQEVVANVPQQVEDKVIGLIDWLVDSDLRQWKSITDYLADRQREHKDNIISDGFNNNFLVDRSHLLEAIRKEADKVVKTYDKHLRTEKIALDAQNAVAASLAVEIGAVGLGTLITALATTMAADITGIVAASVVAVLGLFIIPAQRRKAKRELHERMLDMRNGLIKSLQEEFEKEMKQSLERIEEAIAPYSRFIRSETAHTDAVMDTMETAKTEIERLRTTIESW